MNNFRVFFVIKFKMRISNNNSLGSWHDKVKNHLFKDTWVLHKQVCHVTRTEENRSVVFNNTNWMIYSLIYLAVEISGSILVREVALAE